MVENPWIIPDPKRNFTFPVVFPSWQHWSVCMLSTSNMAVAEQSAAVLKLFIYVVSASFWETGRTGEQKNPSMLDLNEENYDLLGLVALHSANIDIKTPETNLMLYANLTLIKHFKNRLWKWYRYRELQFSEKERGGGKNSPNSLATLSIPWSFV